MVDELSVYTGKTTFKGIDFTFVFDGEELRLIPPKEKENEIIWQWGHRKIEEGAYVPSAPVTVEEESLIGECNETKSRIVFIPRRGSAVGKINAIVLIPLVAYVICRYNRETIDRVSFSCEELNYIHPINSAFSLIMSRDEFQSKGVVSVRTNDSSESTTEKQRFVVDEKELSVYFGVSRTVSTKIHEPPLKLNTSMFFEFDATDDYGFIYKLWWIAREFVRFLCYRKNVHMSKVELSAPCKDGKHERFASMYILNEGEPIEEETLKNGRLIKREYVSGHEGEILTDIANENLYMRHLPDTFSSGRHINAARFVMITAAFEWEFRRLYPDGLKKSDKRVQAENNVTSTIQNLIEASKGKEKDIFKFLVKLVGVKSLKDEIIYIGKEFADIVDIFGEHLYGLNHEKFDYSDIGSRLSEQRNNFAHGNLDKDFIGASLLDVIFMEYVVYAMQLKYFGVEKDMIQKAINDLFHLSIAL